MISETPQPMIALSAVKKLPGPRAGITAVLALLLGGMPAQTSLAASPPMSAADHAAHRAAAAKADAAKSDPALAQEVAELRGKVAKLELAWTQKQPAAAAPMNMPPAGGAMPPAAGGGMGMMKMDEKMGDKMPAGGAPMPAGGGGMGMMKMMGMDMMGKMAAPPPAMPQSGLPGFPGASHLYHVGATDFFLDHSAHITLSTEQQTALNQAKEQALLARNTSERQIEQGEQELWTLTAADKPEITKIEAKMSDIAKMSVDARLAFIKAVGTAAGLLTDDQRKALTGFAPPTPAAGAMPMPGGVAPAASPMPPM